jgi:hypothetical protein
MGKEQIITGLSRTLLQARVRLLALPCEDFMFNAKRRAPLRHLLGLCTRIRTQTMINSGSANNGPTRSVPICCQMQQGHGVWTA